MAQEADGCLRLRMGGRSPSSWAACRRASKADDIRTIQDKRDAKAARKLAEEARTAQDRLKKTDSGGDLIP
jgi:hypothetical protein